MLTNILLCVIIALLVIQEFRASNLTILDAPVSIPQGDAIIEGLKSILQLLEAPRSTETDTDYEVEEGYLYRILIEIRALHTLLEERVPRKF